MLCSNPVITAACGPSRPVLDEYDIDRCPLGIRFDRRERVVIIAVVTDQNAEGRFNLRAKRLQDREDVFSLIEDGDEDIEPRRHSFVSIQRPSAFERRAASMRYCTR